MLGAALDPGRRVREHGGRVHLRPRAGRGRQTHHGRERLSRQPRRLREERLPGEESSDLTDKATRESVFSSANRGLFQIRNEVGTGYCACWSGKANLLKQEGNGLINLRR